MSIKTSIAILMTVLTSQLFNITFYVAFLRLVVYGYAYVEFRHNAIIIWRI